MARRKSRTSPGRGSGVGEPVPRPRKAWLSGHLLKEAAGLPGYGPGLGTSRIFRKVLRPTLAVFLNRREGREPLPWSLLVTP